MKKAVKKSGNLPSGQGRTPEMRGSRDETIKKNNGSGIVLRNASWKHGGLRL